MKNDWNLVYRIPTTNKLSFCDSSMYSLWPYTRNVSWQVREVEETMIHFNQLYSLGFVR